MKEERKVLGLSEEGAEDKAYCIFMTIRRTVTVKGAVPVTGAISVFNTHIRWQKIEKKGMEDV